MKKKPGTKLACGDCLERLKSLKDNSVDTVITDPPYGLSAPPDLTEVLSKWMAGDEYEHKSKGFMGAEWDSFVPGPRVWKEVHRVLKPGGTALVFAGTRTADLMGVSLRLSGLIFRDTIMYLFGTGFPKSHNVGKAIDKAAGVKRGTTKDTRNGPNTRPTKGDFIHGGGLSDQSNTDAGPVTPEAQKWDGWGSSLKPAYEPVLVFQKPLDDTYAQNAIKHGVSGLWIDGGRIPSGKDHVDKCASVVGLSSNRNGNAYGEWGGSRTDSHSPLGRWPANLILDEEAGEMLDEQTEGKIHEAGKARGGGLSKDGGSIFCGNHDGNGARFGDSGGASRFFYCAKASKAEREAGLSGMELGGPVFGDAGGTYQGLSNSKSPRRNSHPTVKPISLMRYLARLTKTPTGGIVLDPFMGSGTTGMAAVLEGRNFIGVELDENYYTIAKKRIKYAKEHPEEFDPDRKPKKAAKKEKTEKGLWDSLNEDKNG